VLGLVPARGGSKGIPSKNIATVGGKPLIAWTIEAASGVVDDLVVSTDSAEIADAAERLGASVLARPVELAGDTTPMRAVVLHALDQLGDPECVVLLQPTSPLRRAEHIREALALFRRTDGDCVVSVVEVPHQYRPSALMRVEHGRLVPAGAERPTRRQDKPLVYARNGPAVLVLRPASVREREDLYGGACYPYLMEARDSLDVDDLFDLELADLLLRERDRQGAAHGAR
jgi:CMP-N,N'-diacetyllegionaminic acid synthase